MSVRRFRLVTLPLVGLALAVLGLGLGAVTSPTMAQDVPVPPAVQVPLLLKILTFDRHLAAAAEPLVVGVVFQRRNRASAAIGDEVRVLLTASARPIRVIVIDLDETRVTHVELSGVPALERLDLHNHRLGPRAQALGESLPEGCRVRG